MCELEFDNNVPIYIQVIDDIKRDIVTGALPPGERLLSARDLAIKYQINPNTASRIYKELEMEELCYTKRGLGTFVTEDRKKVENIREEMSDILTDKFIKGMKELGFLKEELINLILERYERG